MAAAGADIVDARVATSEGVVLDVFRVQDGVAACNRGWLQDPDAFEALSMTASDR